MFWSTLSGVSALLRIKTPCNAVGRNEDDQFREAPTGVPGQSTTKPGRLRFSEPSPYTIHEPRDGREPPRKACPVFIISIDGKWLTLSDHIERTTRKSSMREPTREKISLTSMPLSPYRLNSNGDFISPPEARSVLIFGPGIGSPSNSASAGLGSNVSTWDTPPFR